MRNIYDKEAHSLVYIPNQLDVLWMLSEPHLGREAGSHNSNSSSHNYRPYLVISSRPFNDTAFVEAMPITSHNHFKLLLKRTLIPLKMDSGKAHGYIAPFQILGRDAIARNAKLMGRADPKILKKVYMYIHDIFAKQLNKYN